MIHVKYHIWVQAINCKHVEFSSLGGGRGHTLKKKKKKSFDRAYLFQKGHSHIEKIKNSLHVRDTGGDCLIFGLKNRKKFSDGE